MELTTLFLINEIKKNAPKTHITIPDNKTIEFKEALIFALLGVLKLRGQINVLASVTGAQKTIHLAKYLIQTNFQVRLFQLYLHRINIHNI